MSGGSGGVGLTGLVLTGGGDHRCDSRDGDMSLKHTVFSLGDKGDGSFGDGAERGVSLGEEGESSGNRRVVGEMMSGGFRGGQTDRGG